MHLVRNPFDCVWSLLNKAATNSFNNSVHSSSIPSTIRAQAPGMFKDWLEHWEAWGGGEDRIPTLHIRYEDLREEPYSNFKNVRVPNPRLAANIADIAQMLLFLGIPFQEDVLRCLVADQDCSRSPSSCRRGEVGSGVLELQAMQIPVSPSQHDPV